MKKRICKWTAGWVAIAFTWMAIGLVSPGQLKAGTVKTERTESTVEAARGDNSETNSFEKEGTTPEIAKKKKFPWIWVAAVVVVAGVIVYFTLIKKPKYELTVEAGAGVAGIPAAGKYTYKKGQKITYNFTCADGFKNLTVLLDGVNAASSGTIVMDKAHGLKATAAQMADYSLLVKTNDGVTGSPAAGTFHYREGTAIPYNYAVGEGYKDLTVLLDGKSTAASGTIIMDQSHGLEATAVKNDEYTLVVQTEPGITGSPASGTYHYKIGTLVSYQYSAAEGIPFAKLDGNPVSPAGSLRMNANHVLKVSRGAQPDIRGKWHIVMKGEKSDFDVLLYGEKANGQVDLLEDPDWWWAGFGINLGRLGTYEISASRVSMRFTSTIYGDCPFSFEGHITSANTMSGEYKYCISKPPIYFGGTWTATRIE
jgi:hypothetical protein